MDNLIRIGDLADFVIYFLGASALVILIIALIYIIRFVKRLDRLIEKNADNINKTVNLVPDVLNNVNDVSVTLKAGIDKAEQTVGTIEDYICETVTTVSESTEGLFDFVSVAGEVMKTILNFFQLGKKK